jgi:hypothetical protein
VISDGLPAGVLTADLGFKVAGFAAGTTVVGAIFTQADFIETLAKSTILVASAGPFRLVTYRTDEFFGHSGRLARFWR